MIRVHMHVYDAPADVAVVVLFLYVAVDVDIISDISTHHHSENGSGLHKFQRIYREYWGGYIHWKTLRKTV